MFAFHRRYRNFPCNSGKNLPATILALLMLSVAIQARSAQPAIPILMELPGGLGGIAFDDSQAYIATSGGVLRTSNSLSGQAPVQVLDLGGCSRSDTSLSPARGIPRVYTHGGSLYVLNERSESAGEHTLCVSDDRGGQFVPADAGLLECVGEYCAFIGGTELAFRGEAIYTNAGGGTNVLVSTDRGAHWNAILGSVASQACYAPAFALVGNRLLIGGECPLDMVFLRAYRLREDGPALASETPEAMKLPPLANRNVHFIVAVPDTPYLFAGVEGGLLRSANSGKSFSFGIKYGLHARLYPYIQHIAFSPERPGAVWVGGFDKAHDQPRPYLAYSKNYGRTWQDISRRLPRYKEMVVAGGEVRFLAMDAAGRLLIGVSLGGAGGVEESGYIAALPIGRR